MKKTDFMKMTNCEWFKFDMLSQWSMLNDKGYEIFDSQYHIKWHIFNTFKFIFIVTCKRTDFLYKIEILELGKSSNFLMFISSIFSTNVFCN